MKNNVVFVGLLTGAFLGLAVAAFSLVPQPWGTLFSLSLILPFLLMMVWNVERLLLAVILLDIPFHFDINLFYSDFLGGLGALGGLNISLSLICIFALYALWFLKASSKKAEPLRLYARYSWPLLLYIGLVGLSISVAENQGLASFEFIMLIQTLLLYLYVANNIRKRGELEFILRFLLIGVILQGLLMLLAFATGFEVDAGPISTVTDPLYGNRVAGTFGSPNAAAGYLSMILIPALALLLAPFSGQLKRLAVFAFALGGAALLVTFSRGGWLGFGFAVFVFYLFIVSRKLISARMNALIIGAFIVIIAALSPLLIQRLFGDDEGAAAGRFPLNTIALEIIQDHPLLGVGANNFIVALPEYLVPQYAKVWLFTVHNKYLLVASEAGIFALFAFLSFLFSSLILATKVWRAKDAFISVFGLALGLAVLANMLHMLVDIFNARPHVQLLWFYAGLLVALRVHFVPELRSYRFNLNLAPENTFINKQPALAQPIQEDAHGYRA